MSCNILAQVKLHIESPSGEDREKILSLLKDSGLTLEGIEDCEFWVAKNSESKVIGAVGLETWGAQGLLRSLVVERNTRGKGVGRELVFYTIDQARRKHLKELYLVTEAVKEYYLKLGFELVERGKVQGTVLNSAEFRGACLVSADVMRTIL